MEGSVSRRSKEDAEESNDSYLLQPSSAILNIYIYIYIYILNAYLVYNSLLD